MVNYMANEIFECKNMKNQFNRTILELYSDEKRFSILPKTLPIEIKI
jgi:hypothetical protein